MRRVIIMTVVLATLLLSVTACAGNHESEENQASTSDTTDEGQTEERMDEKDFTGKPNGDPAE